MSEAIIPGLPDDLAFRCLAKISHGYHGLLECVSKKWRWTIKSSDYANLKAKEGWCGNWLFACTHMGHKSQWNAYDPDANRWHPVPGFPWANYESLRGCSCICVCKRFLVVGGCYMKGNLGTNNVIMFDPFKQQWSCVSSMRTARTNFASAAINDKVYVAGGNNSDSTEGLSAAEVYDPYLDRWEDLPPMPFVLFECFSVSYGGQFHVIGKKASNFEYDTYVIFNPINQTWHIVEDLWPFSKLSREYTTVTDGGIYAILDDDIVKVTNKYMRPLGTFPAIILQGHVRPLKPFGFSLIGFKQKLYVVGGMALRYDSDARSYDVVELSTVRSFDPTKMPLEWCDVRPMPVQSSGVIGCALVE
ncbi:uncharacterized protein A4U43_C05F2620 [Asparagus officinalis]|uniref:F-box domain-containing protein n=1 Tax=Asparagus officinalis TaxID=4686 RepID=A0A5P1EUB2_ASPOF|nr:F-box/kelch-repeat protein At1g16250 [Asparagus officinalis]XP_020267794.1 F-box/kelch-repeat protein At1g16250 [Asparagus officinalis]ONK67680.1 uncharacterized protein A4U43_C05F2620 [Asparagus officinalis]